MKKIILKIICKIKGHIPGEWLDRGDSSKGTTTCLRCGAHGWRSQYSSHPFKPEWF